MPRVNPHPMAIALAVTKGDSLSPVAALLALQRAEEPQTPLRIHEITRSDLHPGLDDGRYNVVITSQTEATAEWICEPLWRDELGIALPVRSPLLANAAIAIDMLLSYEVLLWPPYACETSRGQIALLGKDAADLPTASSFELMATLVAAGYCVGLAPRSRIMQARRWGIILRPLAGGPHPFTTQLIRAQQGCPPAVERFAERARRIAADHP